MPVKKNSRIAQITRLLGPHGIIRSSSRLRQLVEIDFDSKHSIVLDACPNFFKLFQLHTHSKDHHQAINYWWSKVKERHTILKLRSSLRTIKSNCVLCVLCVLRVLFRESNIQPIMEHLLKERLEHQSPFFTNTGADFFRSFYVTVRRTTKKRWGFLFTCLTTRAVNVDVVPSMDTSSCFIVVERFVSRRLRLLWFGQIMVWISLVRRKISVNAPELDQHRRRTCAYRH